MLPHAGEDAVGQTVEQIQLPQFKDAPVVKRLIRKIEAEDPQRRQDRPLKRISYKIFREQFPQDRLGIGITVSEPVVEGGSTH